MKGRDIMAKKIKIRTLKYTGNVKSRTRSVGVHLKKSRKKIK